MALVFIEGNAKQSYLELRQSTVMSDIEQHHDAVSVVWQQEGVLSHFGRNVRAISIRNFLCGWVHRGSANWSPTSPNITPCVFPCAVQSKVRCTARSCHILQMKKQIHVEFHNVNEDKNTLCSNLQMGAYDMFMCTEHGGQHFEPFL